MVARRKYDSYLKSAGVILDISSDDRIGNVIREIRRNNQETLGNLAKAIGVSLGFLAKIERGERGITQDKLDKIATHYKLDPISARQLINIAGFPIEQDPLAIAITPEEERDTQIESSLNEVWIASRYLSNWGPLYEAITHNIANNDTHYVLFQDNQFEFSAIHGKLETEKGITKQKLNTQLECVICPQHYFFSSFVIYNPRNEDMQVHLFHHSNNRVSHAYRMDEESSFFCRDTLNRVYCLLENQNSSETSLGKIERIFPEK